MPAILTHYTFALSALPEEDKAFQRIVNLGSQGPDTFMAYGTIPWIKRNDKKKVQEFGHAMHRIDVADTYYKMAEYAKKSEHADLLFAFLDGLLMHYCVDRIMHAYIFYRSGVDENGKLTGYYGWSHGFFEAILDKVFAKERGTYQKLSKCILNDDEQVKECSKMWAACAPTPLGEDDYYLSYVDFVSAENMLWNPRGTKRPLFRLLGKYSTPYSQAHPVDVKKFAPLDITNKNHAEWKNPATGEAHNWSIDEMFDMALDDFKAVHQLIVRFRNGEDIKQAMRDFTSNRDHEGGPVGVKKHIYDLCWNVLGKKKYLPSDE